MTEHEIELRAERMMDALDKRYMRDEIETAAYHDEVETIRAWTRAAYLPTYGATMFNCRYVYDAAVTTLRAASKPDAYSLFCSHRGLDKSKSHFAVEIEQVLR
jgi:hypothetical protein